MENNNSNNDIAINVKHNNYKIVTNYPFCYEPEDVLTWVDVLRKFTQQKNKKCPEEVRVLDNILNQDTRLTSTEFFNAPWKAGEHKMAHIIMLVQSVERCKKRKLLNVTLNNMDQQNPTKIAIIVWDENALRLQMEIKENHVIVNNF